MALQKQILEIPLGQGIETKQTRHTVPADRLTKCHQGRWAETNRLEKRYPYVTLGRTLYSASDATAGTLAAAMQVGACGMQCLIVNAETEVSRLCAAVDSGGVWRQSNRLPGLYCSRRPVYHASPVRSDCQSATTGGLTATVFSGADGELRAIVHDESSGDVAVAEKVLTSNGGTSTVFRVLAVGSWLVVVHIDPADGAILARCLSTAAPSLGWSWSETITATHVVDLSNLVIDAHAVTGSTTDIRLAYNEDPAELIVQHFRRDHTAGTWSTIHTSSAIAETSAVATCLVESGDATHVLCAWIGEAATYRPRWWVLDASGLTTDTAPADLSTDNASAANIITAVARPATSKDWAVLYDNGIGQELSI